MHIQPHSRARNRRGREASPVLFENQKKCPDFGKKGPDCASVWAKFTIQNAVLRVSRRNDCKMCF